MSERRKGSESTEQGRPAPPPPPMQAAPVAPDEETDLALPGSPLGGLQGPPMTSGVRETPGLL